MTQNFVDIRFESSDIFPLQLSSFEAFGFQFVWKADSKKIHFRRAIFS